MVLENNKLPVLLVFVGSIKKETLRVVAQKAISFIHSHFLNRRSVELLKIFQVNIPFLLPLSFSDVFIMYKKETLGRNGLIH